MNRPFERSMVFSPTWCAAVLVLAAVLFAARLHLPLLEPEEARYAEIPRQMLTHDRILVPIHDRQDYLDKPPLLYWMVMASYRLFGVHDWAARLPTVLAAWLTVGVVLGWGWRVAGFGAGLTGAAVLTLTGDFVYRAPMVTMNGPLGLCVALSLATGHIAILDRFRWPWWLLSGAACGLGIMMKGLVAAALVGPVFIVWPLVDRRLSRPKILAWLAWGAAASAVAGPWFVAVAIRHPEFVEYFFWKHHAVRYATPFDHAGPIWAYIPQLVLGLLPWSLLALGLSVRSLSRVDTRDGELSLARAALVAGLWGFAFFSLAGSKRPVYLVPVEPPLALAAGAYFWSRRSNLAPTVWRGIGLATALAIAVGVVVWLPAYSERFSVASVVKCVRDADVPIYCYGHGWDSVGFYLQRDDVSTFLSDDRSAIGPALARNSSSLVFVTTKQIGDDFVTHVPAGMTFRVLAANGQVRMGIVEPCGPKSALE